MLKLASIPISATDYLRGATATLRRTAWQYAGISTSSISNRRQNRQKEENMKKRIGFTAVSLIVLGLAAVRSKALQIERGPAVFGLIGVTAFETARLNAFCPSDPSVPPGPCA